MKHQCEVHPKLMLKTSSLGEDVGLGLYATEFIDEAEMGGILLQPFGKIIVATNAEVTIKFSSIEANKPDFPL